MKKLILLLTCLLAVSIFAGCNKTDAPASSAAPEESSSQGSEAPQTQADAPFRIQGKDGSQIYLGMTDDEVEAIVGDTMLTVEYVEEAVERHQYREHDSVFVDFHSSKAVHFRIREKTDDEGEATGGNEDWWVVVPLSETEEAELHILKTQKEIIDLFPAESINNLVGSAGDDKGFSIAFGSDYLPTVYSDDAPYLLHVYCDSGYVMEYIMNDTAF